MARKQFITFLLTLSLFSLLIAAPSDKKVLIGSNASSPNSRVIIGNGAKVFIDNKALARVQYDDIVVMSGAKLIFDTIKSNLALFQDESDMITASAEASVPTEFEVSGAYPNPFNPTVNISYGLPNNSDVRILIHDLSGRLIANYTMNQQSAGWHDFNWNANDHNGQSIGSGIYLMTIQASNMVKKQKITFLK